jgi:hypothetical protein
MKTAVSTLVVGCAALAASALALPPAPPSAAPVSYEKKDSQGRVITSVTFHPDGTVSHSATAFGQESEKLIAEEELDQKHEPVRRIREKTDRKGRLVEREEMATEHGRRITKRTQFKYDAKGRQTVETQVTE